MSSIINKTRQTLSRKIYSDQTIDNIFLTSNKTKKELSDKIERSRKKMIILLAIIFLYTFGAAISISGANTTLNNFISSWFFMLRLALPVFALTIPVFFMVDLLYFRIKGVTEEKTK